VAISAAKERKSAKLPATRVGLAVGSPVTMDFIVAVALGNGMGVAVLPEIELVHIQADISKNTGTI
jgi:hypothetical protein